MNQALSEDRFAAFIGLDWADVQHDACLQAVGRDELEFSFHRRLNLQKPHRASLSAPGVHSLNYTRKCIRPLMPLSLVQRFQNRT